MRRASRVASLVRSGRACVYLSSSRSPRALAGSLHSARRALGNEVNFGGEGQARYRDESVVTDLILSRCVSQRRQQTIDKKTTLQSRKTILTSLSVFKVNRFPRRAGVPPWRNRFLGRPHQLRAHLGKAEIDRRYAPYSFGSVSALSRRAFVSISPMRQATSSGQPIFNPCRASTAWTNCDASSRP
jgi:hypothetical protein